MARARISTTVDAELLAQARQLRPESNDATLMDSALAALAASHRAAVVDASYRTYEDQPLDEPDQWGDLASFRQAAGAS